MKLFTTYINESKESYKWVSCVKKMYKWYCDNFGQTYAHKHNNDNNKICDLIGKEVKADCSGFIGACLCLAGYTDDPINWNVKFGSFNDDGRNNNDDKPINCDEEKLNYMKDLSNWEPHLFKQDEINPGDIIYSSFHVTIAADKGAKHLYDWGSQIEDREDDINQPVKFYQQEYKYRAYWRINNGK